MQIMATRNTAASGKAIEAGKTYSAPGDISEADARALVRMGKAEIVKHLVVEQLTERPERPLVTREAPKPKRGRKRK